MTPEQVPAIVKSLPLRLRRVFVMRFVEKRPRVEIAAMLHISERQVGRRIVEALKRCGGRLG